MCLCHMRREREIKPYAHHKTNRKSEREEKREQKHRPDDGRI